jgi:hypothetical protein
VLFAPLLQNKHPRSGPGRPIDGRDALPGLGTTRPSRPTIPIVKIPLNSLISRLVCNASVLVIASAPSRDRFSMLIFPGTAAMREETPGR